MEVPIATPRQRMPRRFRARKGKRGDQTMRAVRIIARPTPDNPDEAPLYLDATVDDADMIVGQRALFGLQGEFNKPEVHFYPFVLHEKGGRMNFGRGYEEIGQYAALNIREVPIRIGQLITRRSDWAPQVGHLRIDQIIQLAPEPPNSAT
jgi:hypothetical protein